MRLMGREIRYFCSDFHQYLRAWALDLGSSATWRHLQDHIHESVSLAESFRSGSQRHKCGTMQNVMAYRKIYVILIIAINELLKIKTLYW